ncbi:DUF6443 domain-containing protein [Chryseobacterium sp. JAH]|uniref:DUF6443 domain-containing protein n=1 Tax=Chryseobacterium sp. JAH TaxID=1742858 RepID=UPI000740C987|nr:DUF6443 domain-containing protein [Chryseobacterium sp. JAH]KUJ50904.1 hypothetical protein AR685_11755 [Chryseobacterium sp. JAH]
MKRNLNIFLLLLPTLLTYAQSNQFSANENYVYTKNCLNEDCSKKSEAIEYSDGLGRAKQVISIKATPLGRDIVTPIDYDDFGRNLKSYLPIPQNQTQNGAIYANPHTNAPQSYGTDIYYYSSSTVESSPIGKPLSSKKPGADYQSHSITYAYEVNAASDVKLYTVQTTWQNGATKDVITPAAHYAAGQLFKNSVTDVDGNVTTEFVNGKGQTVMVRKAGNPNSDTYYIYNKYSQLVAVVPPLANALVIDETTLNNLCYQYKYDAKGRQVEKKLPGKGWEYMVYDKLDRVVMTQDANMGSSKKWLFTKFDKYGRTVFTGIFTSTNSYSSAERQAEQNQLNGATTYYESRSTGGFAATGETAYYTNTVYPTSFSQILSINYYDTYPQGSPARPTSVFGKTTISDDLSQNINTKNLPTASYVKNLENDNWTKSYSWYDEKSRMVGTYSINHLGGYTKTESDLDFAGVPQTTKAYHKRLASDAEKVITQTFEYDGQNRLKKQYHQIAGQPAAELLSDNSYNELSQLSSKAVGGGLEIVSYTYNIRGSLLKINDPSNLGTKLFGYELNYYAPASNASGRRSGNVEEAIWKSAQDGITKKYTYRYDALNRMTSGVYTEPGAALPKDNFYNEVLTYDLGGNISTLKRTGGGIGSIAKEIDDLTYAYVGNKLQTVTDSKDNLSGYPTGGNIFEYDLNGNMTKQQDKGISNIAYNLLDLPSTVTQKSNAIQYLYRADGSKLRKTSSGVTTDYVDGFQYEEGVLKFVPTAEGYFNFENNKYIYNYTDHLGNIRLSYTKNGSVAAIIEESNFYPYGMKQENTLQTNPAYNYEHSGKEFQKETGWSDFGARMYMADIGRWGVIDPLAETTTRINPYNYALDNPISFIDPDGRKAMAIEDRFTWNVAPDSGWFGSRRDYKYGAFEEFVKITSIYERERGGAGGVNLAGTEATYDEVMVFLGLKQPDYFAGIDFSQFGSENSNNQRITRKQSLAAIQKQYPRFYKVLAKLHDFLDANPKILSSLSEDTGLTKAQVLNFLDVNSAEGPVYMFKKMNNLGEVGHLSVTSINYDLIRTFETLQTNSYVQGTSFLLGITVLHEFVHWGRTKSHLPYRAPTNKWNISDYGSFWEQKNFNMTTGINQATVNLSNQYGWKF